MFRRFNTQKEKPLESLPPIFFDLSNDFVPSRLLCVDHHRARRGNLTGKKVIMFLILAVVLVLLWIGGFFVLHISSFLIHLLLIFALIAIVMNFVGGRRAV